MSSLTAIAHTIELSFSHWARRHGIDLLRISLGIVFFWFGFLKFFPGLSPAEQLASETIKVLSFGLLSADISLRLLATWECAIGIGLIFRLHLRATLFLLFLQMLGTFTPLFLFPALSFAEVPWVPNLEGQYILKNLVLVSAVLVIGGFDRGTKRAARPLEAMQP